MTMRQRITHFLPERRRVDPADIEVEKGGLNFTRSQEAAEEWRLTLSLDELPDEVGGHFQCHSGVLLISVRFERC